MNLWALPKTHDLGGTRYGLNTDFRDVLEIIQYLNDDSKPEFLRWQIAVGLFYEQPVPDICMGDAMQYLSEFINCGLDNEKPGAKLIDWEQDAQIIVADINKVAGKEVRALQYMHWWTFIGLFSGIGEGQLSMIVSIRHKKATGKKLEKWEQEFYREHRDKVDFRKKADPEEERLKAYYDKWM